MRRELARELQRIFRNAAFALEVLVDDRHRVVSERDSGHVGALRPEFGLRHIGGLAAIRSGPGRSGEDQNPGCCLHTASHRFQGD
jgi:hypothetical protein